VAGDVHVRLVADSVPFDEDKLATAFLLQVPIFVFAQFLRWFEKKNSIRRNRLLPPQFDSHFVRPGVGVFLKYFGQKWRLVVDRVVAAKKKKTPPPLPTSAVDDLEERLRCATLRETAEKSVKKNPAGTRSTSPVRALVIYFIET